MNTGQDIGSAASLTVGDVLSCSAEDAISYRWTSLYDSEHTVTYGKTLSVAQSGTFSYLCTAFVQCNTSGYDTIHRFFETIKTEGSVFCPLTRSISGFAGGRITLYAKYWCITFPFLISPSPFPCPSTPPFTSRPFCHCLNPARGPGSTALP